MTPAVSKLVFPRSRERGPIEAQSSPFLSPGKNRRFRAHVSAAPLKRDQSGFPVFLMRPLTPPLRPNLRSRCFRAHVSAAPLKRVLVW